MQGLQPGFCVWYHSIVAWLWCASAVLPGKSEKKKKKNQNNRKPYDVRIFANVGVKSEKFYKKFVCALE